MKSKHSNRKSSWEIEALTQTSKKEDLRLDVVQYKGKKFEPKNEKEAQSAVDFLNKSHYVVTDLETKPTGSKPRAPFITSTLQQTASTRLGFGVKKTMMLAQRLYEAGYITYMRTDSTNLSQDALNMARSYIESHFGKDYLPAKPNFYSSKENAQEAHEAIRPSDVKMLADHLSGMDKDAVRLYDLIWRQFVACQMPAAQYDSTTVTVMAGDYELKAKGRILRFDGWTKVLPQLGKNPEDQILPAVSLNETLALKTVSPSQHFTKPPARSSLKLHWLKNWRNVVLVVLRLMRQLFRLFKSVVMCALKIAVSMPRKWVKSLLIA